MKVSEIKGNRSSTDTIQLIDGSTPDTIELLEFLSKRFNREDEQHPNGKGSQMLMDLIDKVFIDGKVTIDTLYEANLPKHTMRKHLKRILKNH